MKNLIKTMIEEGTIDESTLTVVDVDVEYEEVSKCLEQECKKGYEIRISRFNNK